MKMVDDFNRLLLYFGRRSAENDKGKLTAGSTGDRRLKSYAIKDIANGTFFSQALYLDGRFVVAAPEMPFTAELARALLDWDFREVQSDGDPSAAYVETMAAEAGDADAAVSVAPPSDNERVKRAVDFYQRFQDYVETLFTRFVTKNDININETAERIKELCEVIKESRRFLLRIQDQSNSERNYLASHTVRSTIIAVVVGTYLKLPNHRLIELGTAALLHEIGMLKLPPQLYMTGKPLTPPERKAILTHPVLGYNVLRSLNFPLAISVAALEHHERENGAGYPRQVTGDKISIYAKIIAVACSYEALTAIRPYKTAKDGYASMIDLLKNVGKQYDDQIVRALVYSLSIYPIGLYVLLSNGQQAQVVDVNPENPRFPIVQLIGEKAPDGKDRLMETAQNGVQIVRPLVKNEVDLLKAQA
jgi:HD-GYP domain-containing protein (c-di-GMP phosphodiesterase class II)